MSKQAEGALLGAVLRDGSQYVTVRDIVSQASFEWECYRWAWDACEALHSRGMSIDAITVGDELERAGKLSEFMVDPGYDEGRMALAKLRTGGDPKNVLSYAENVQDYAVKRLVDALMAKGAYWAQNGRRARDVISDVMSELSKMTVYAARDEYTVGINVAASEAYDWTGKAAAGEIVGIKTGLIELDAIIGGMYGGNIYLVAGRPGQGKTALLTTIGHNAAKAKKNVAIFSLEMSRAQIAHRFIAQASGVNLFNITNGKMTDADWPLFTHAVEEVSALPISINDLTSINVNEIRQTARKLKTAGKLDLLILDYIQLASGGDKSYERRELEVSSISRGLKYLARELDIPVLVASQFSRAIESRADKKPVLSDLRESGSLEQDAFCVIMLHNPDGGKVFDLLVEKNRNGPKGTCSVVYNETITRFDNATFRHVDLNASSRKDLE